MTVVPADEAASRVSIDRVHRKVHRAQIEVARVVRAAVADAGLDRTLVELVNIRVSQINGCAYCLHVHVRDALSAGESSQRIAVLPAWRDTRCSPTPSAQHSPWPSRSPRCLMPAPRPRLRGGGPAPERGAAVRGELGDHRNERVQPHLDPEPPPGQS